MSLLVVWCMSFLKEISNNKLMIEIWKPEEQSFSNLFENFLDSEYDSFILICMNTEGIDWSQVDRVKYQKSIQTMLKESEYKNCVFHHLKNIQKWRGDKKEVTLLSN